MSIGLLEHNTAEIPPWKVAAYSPITLLAMLEFSAHLFFELAQVLKSESEYYGYRNSYKMERQLDDSHMEHLRKAVQVSNDLCERLGLKFSCLYLKGMGEQLEDCRVSSSKASEMLEVLSGRISDEMKSCLFMQIPTLKAEFYAESQQFFGNEILQKFPAIIYDAEEAGKSYATGRNTACVFHLSRVMEHGLRAIGVSLGLTEQNPNWEAVLKKCDGELAKHLKDRCTQWKDDDTFFSEATANLRAVKNAWRNPTMHVGSKYTDYESEDIYRSVRGFMRHLSDKLSDEAIH